ncbi:glycosyltransferase [Anoxynatronum buryatiense]|uniref:Glycosyltransferase involved in cell wall bisynthesis n=1 Tax=Anoxynatronum buryatiense TaxID=489973 RepID=A0AA45WVS0_9CLOT|nr:glycosyltransferase [Anoxynatronum buryatiense]SMP54866.1 Glycosyltransferase involved in cell wall bisynthesis [Anoxynatronum buryatiense]
MGMTKLFIIISSMTFGGAEMQTLELANGLVDRGYDIEIAVLDHKQEIIDKGRPEIRFHILKKKNYLDRRVVKALKERLSVFQPHLVLCVDLYPALYFRLAARGNSAPPPVATVFHSTLPRDTKERFQRWYLTRLLKKNNRLVFVSEKQKEYWLRTYKGLRLHHARTIHNGIHLERFYDFLKEEAKLTATRRLLAYEPNQVIIGNCSSFRVEKRHQDLLEAVHRLKSDGHPVKLLLIGDGDQRAHIEKRIRELGMEESVYITGHIADVRPYLAMVDVFVLTSDSVETLSIAAIESQAMKKAAVLSDIGGASEIVQDGVNGYLYAAGNVDQLTDCLRKILQHERWKPMGEAAYHHARQHFDRRQMVEAYHQLLMEMKGGSHGG